MTILVGYIPSPQGEAALEHGITEARRRGARLVVLNASPVDRLVDDRRVYDDQVADLEQRLGSSAVEHELRRPVSTRQVAEEILDTAQDVGADLIVIGLRRRSPTGKLIFGSTAQRILLGAACPVLAVKAPATAE